MLARCSDASRRVLFLGARPSYYKPCPFCISFLPKPVRKEDWLGGVGNYGVGR